MTVSVIIPSYNGSRHIRQAILSALHQQRPPEEILVCDDNSTDGTLDICRQYEGRLTIYKNPDGPSGFVNGWNNAIARASTDYVSILHQDDTLAPDFLRIGMAALERHPGIRHLFSTCRYIDDESRPFSCSYTERTPDESGIRLTGAEYVRYYQMLGHPHIHRCPGVITHRSIFDQCRYEAGAGHIADDDFFYRVGMYTDIIGILQPLASFRIHKDSATGSLQDAELSRKLMEDYIYQCRQWMGHPFMNDAAYSYFVRNAHKYIRRSIGYGIKQRSIDSIVRAIRQWKALKVITWQTSSG